MKKYIRSAYFLPLSILADTISVNLAFFLSYLLRFRQINGVLEGNHLLLFWFFNATWFLLILLLNPYREPRVTFNIPKLIYTLFTVLFIHAGVIAFFWVFTKGYTFSRIRLTLLYLLAFTFSSTLRVVGVLFLRYLRKQGYNLRNYVVVGYGELSSTIVKYYTDHPEMGYVFKGYYDSKIPQVNQHDELDEIDNLQNIIKDSTIDYIYCCIPYLNYQMVDRIISLAEKHKIFIKLLIDFRGFTAKAISVEYHDYLPVFNVSSKPHFDKKAMLVKRMFDLGFAGSVMVLGAPVFLLVTIITKLTSTGPVFYKSERAGMWGKHFMMYKFRSMHQDASSLKHIVLTTGSNDSRITGWGRIMRKTRLDELPQLINVLRGDMSIVGPRPGIPRYNEEVIKIAPEFGKLLTIKPGVTSIGQISYGYAETAEQMVDRMRFDLKYLDKYSVRKDLYLIFKTAQVMVQQKGV